MERGWDANKINGTPTDAGAALPLWVTTKEAFCILNSQIVAGELNPWCDLPDIFEHVKLMLV